MLNVSVHQGSVAVGRSSNQPYILIQAEDQDGSGRAALSPQQARDFIKEIQDVLDEVACFPEPTKDWETYCQFLYTGDLPVRTEEVRPVT